jgi:hypothetical protein
MTSAPKLEPVWRLRTDLASAKLRIWVSSLGRDAHLSPETHLYLATRYDQLSHHYIAKRRYPKARQFARLAREHYLAGGWDGPPYAAALALPVPERWVIVEAVSRVRTDVA